MKLSEKIVKLRKSNGWSQEEFAEKLDVSRQAVSRWEVGTAQPDAMNILQLSKLFGVTADYLLNDDYESDMDIPRLKETHEALDIKKDSVRKLSLIATLAFLLSSFIWLVLAINDMEIIYVILAVANAVISGVNLFIYEKNQKQDK